MKNPQTTKQIWTAADILWETNRTGCQISMLENGRVIVHPDMLKEAQEIADERNKNVKAN